MENTSNSDSDSNKLATKQEILQKSVDGVNEKIDKVSNILSNAIVDGSQIVHSSETPDADPTSVKLNLTTGDIQFLKDEVTQLRNVMNGYVTEIETLKQEILEKCDAEVKKVKILVNDQDQYNRKNNAMFTSLQVLPPPTKDPAGKIIRNPNDNATFCQFIANQLNHYLPDLTLPVSLNTIDTAHPLRNNSKGESLVIVRFANRHQKLEIMGYKKLLKSFGIGVYDQLTPINVELMRKAKAKVGAINVWSTNGKIFARTDKEKVRITLNTNFNDLTPPPPVEANSAIDSSTSTTNNNANKHVPRRTIKEKRARAPRGNSVRNFSKPPPQFFYGSQPSFMVSNNNAMAYGAGQNNHQPPGYSGW